MPRRLFRGRLGAIGGTFVVSFVGAGRGSRRERPREVDFPLLPPAPAPPRGSLKPSATVRPRVWGRGGVPASWTRPKGVGGAQSPIFWSSPPEGARDFFPPGPAPLQQGEEVKVSLSPAGRGWRGTGGEARGSGGGWGALSSTVGDAYTPHKNHLHANQHNMHVKALLRLSNG